MISAVRTWGTTPAERARMYACDRFLRDPHEVCYRAIDVQAPRDTVFRWLCQLRAAPYSYDWIDNFGRTSPRHLVPGLDELAVGQRAMTCFEIADFDPGVQITFVLRRPRRWDGMVAVSYAVVPRGASRSRITVKLIARYPNALWRLLRRLPVLGTLAAAGDLVMMRRQLMNLRDLAEGRGGGPPLAARALGGVQPRGR